MKLADWRREQGLSQADLADALSVTQGFVSLVERLVDPRIPRRDQMISIYRLTKGAVTPNDFYDLPALDQLELAISGPAPAPLLEAAQQ